MKLDKHFWFGINSLFCKIVTFFGRLDWCYSKPAPPPPPPPPETVWLAICTVSGAISNVYCPSGSVEDREFIVGSEPTAYCIYHKKPDPIPKVAKDRLYSKTGKAVSPYFLMGLPVNVGEASDEEVLQFANRITSGQHGNKLRFLVGCSGFYQQSHLDIIEPFFHKSVGGYHLDLPNERWFDTLFRRVGYFIERDWLVELNFFNNSDMNQDEEWALHPLNKNNNHGFYVPELGRVHPTHDRPESFIGHWSEWDAVEPGKLWWEKEEYAYRSEEEMTAEDYLDMNMNRAVREFHYDYCDLVLRRCVAEWGDKFWVGHNEWAARINWHLDIMSPIYTKHGIPKERRETSFLYWDWYKSGAEVFKSEAGYLGRWHGVWSEDICTFPGGKLPVTFNHLINGDYLPSDVKLMFSGDGVPWMQRNWDIWGKDYDKVKGIVKACLTHGRGYELNSDFTAKLFDIDFHAGAVCGEAYGEWLNENT